jgi:hypothetical protein
MWLLAVVELGRRGDWYEKIENGGKCLSNQINYA